MSHSFSYLSSLPLVTDPIAVALNNCARDHLHKDHCAQAFGRNTLSKPHNATTTPTPAGGGSKTRAQESPSTSDVELEYDTIPPDKGKGKAVPNNTVQGGSRHDPPREWERTSHLLRRNESDDHSQSPSICCCLTRRLDDKDTWDELASKVRRVVESLAESMRNIEERHAETQASIASLNQRINALRKKYQEQEETTHSWDRRLWDSWSQTHHTRNDKLGLTPQRDSCPTREGCKQDGPLCCPSNGPDDRSQRLSPQNSQKDLDEETPVDAMARSRWEAEHWEWLENDTPKCHRKALGHMIQAAEEAVEHTKIITSWGKRLLMQRMNWQRLFKLRTADTEFRKQAWTLNPT